MAKGIVGTWQWWREHLRWPVLAAGLYVVVAAAAIAGTGDRPARGLLFVALYAALGLVLVLPRPTMPWRVGLLLVAALVVAVRHHLDGGAGLLPERLMFDVEGSHVFAVVTAAGLPVVEAIGAGRRRQLVSPRWRTIRAR